MKDIALLALRRHWMDVTARLDEHLAGKARYSRDAISQMLGELNCLTAVRIFLTVTSYPEWMNAISDYRRRLNRPEPRAPRRS